MNAKEISMTRYGITTWPASHVRSQASCDCRGYACVLMRDAGMSYPEIAREAGFADHTSAMYAVTRYKAAELKKMGHLSALMGYFNQLIPTQGELI